MKHTSVQLQPSCSVFVTTANGEQPDIYNLTTIPSVQRSLCLEKVTDNQTRDMLERCMATCGKPQEQVPKCGLVHEKKH